MKTSRFLAAGAALGGLVACQQKAQRPNIIFFLTDGSRLAARHHFASQKEAYDFVIPESVRGTGQPVPMPDEVLY